MALAMCPLCTDDEEVELVRRLDDGRREVRCPRCDYRWTHRQAEVPATATMTPRSIGALRGRLPTVEDVDPAVRGRADGLKAQFLERRPHLDPGVAEYWAHYQRIFSRVDPADDRASLARARGDRAGRWAPPVAGGREAPSP